MTITDHRPTSMLPVDEEGTARGPRFLWLDLTRQCQLACTHCYNDSGPDGDHGTMTRTDWLHVLTRRPRSG